MLGPTEPPSGSSNEDVTHPPKDGHTPRCVIALPDFRCDNGP